MASSSPLHEELNSRSTLEETTHRPPAAPDETVGAVRTITHAPVPGSLSSVDNLQLPRQQSAAERNGDRVHSARQPRLPFPLLMDIAEAIHNREQCIRLAAKLNLGEDQVLKVLAETFTARVPVEVLSAWIDTHRHRATGCVLHAALIEIERLDLADRFEGQLLGEEANIRAGSTVEQTFVLQPVDTEVADVSQKIPSLDLLVEIAFSLPKLKHCVRLANSLELGVEFVERVRAGVFALDTAALNVLCKWRQSKSTEATSGALFNALVAIQRTDIAACFAERLLGQEPDDWEEACFDDKHRDFFRTLRRWQIDVVVAYECMRCSRNFLGHLQHWGIVERQEYEDLVCFSQSLLRSAMNKKLLDVVNQKPVQLQEMFAELLCRHQPHLMIEDEGGSSALSGLSGDLTDSPWRLHGENLVTDFKDELRRWFNQLIIARPLDFVACEDFQPVSEIYVTLSSMSYEEAVKLVGAPRQLCGSELLRAADGVAAESKHSKELLDLHSLLRYPQGMQAKSAILFGSAGSGKSLTVLKILSEWNSQNPASPFKQFDVVVHITGRERSRVNTKDVHDLWQLWQMGYTKQQQDFLITHYAHHSEKVLYLVDAWDEAGDDGLLQEDTVLKKILRGDLFRHSCVIITSRPAPNAYPLLEDCKRRYSLVGFNNKRLRELFSRRLEERQALRLFNTLSQSSHLHVKSAVQKTPLFAAMLIQLYKMEETLPRTITALYQSVLECICARYVQWVKDTQAGKKSGLANFDKKPAVAEFTQVEAKLTQLALAGWLSNRVTFTEQEALSCGKAAIQPRFGLLSEVKEVGMCSSRVLYHFNHLTWQEYLAAHCLAADPNFTKKLSTCLTSIGVGEHTRLFWRFVAGQIESHLLPILVFEVLKTSGVTGQAPWEAEIRLFLMECVAEHIRMGKNSTIQYIQLSAELIAPHQGHLVLNGCYLDASRLSSLALVLTMCPNIWRLAIVDCYVDQYCPTLPALDHLSQFEAENVAGQGASSLLANVLSSLSGSSSITRILFGKVIVTRECLSAIAEVINNCKSLTEFSTNCCEFGSLGIQYLSRTIRCSYSLSKLVFENEDFAGAGGCLGDVGSRLPRLRELQLGSCCLGNEDMEGLLTGLQSSCSLEVLHVSRNKITDGVAAPLLQYAVHRKQLAEQTLALFLDNLPMVQVSVASNQVSQDMIHGLSVRLPVGCKMVIFSDQVYIAPNNVSEINHVAEMKHRLNSSTDNHLVFRCPGTGDRGALGIAHFLTTASARRMTSLALTCCDICDDGAVAVIEAVRLTNLQGLDLSDNCITFRGFHQLMSTLSSQCEIKYLSLCKNPIFARSAASQGQLTPSILNLALSVHCLEIVSLSSTQFSDDVDCFENSPLALMAIRSLSALDLSDNEITDNSITMVTAWMDKVDYLSLSGNRITSDGGKALMGKAQALLDSVCDQRKPACRLQRIWLGGNLITESVFADCRCEVVSSQSLSLYGAAPKVVPSLFLLPAADRFLSSGFNQLQLGTSGQRLCLDFWVRINEVVRTKAFWESMDHFIENKFSVCCNHWLSVAFQALGNDDGSLEPIRLARTLINLFTVLGKWYLKEKNGEMVAAVQCYKVAVIEELVLTCSLSELSAVVDEDMEILARNCAADLEFCRLTVHCLSGVAQRCRQRQLYSVADKLMQRLEMVMQHVMRVTQFPFNMY